MLLEEFDKSKTAFINPNTFIKKIKNFPKITVSFFSRKIMSAILENYKYEIIGEISFATGIFPVYKIKVNGVNMAVYQSTVGAPSCAGNQFEEVIEMGCKNLLLVGCCGCLKEEMEDYSIILPTSAIRDEGTSYHYLPASDEIKLSSKCIKILEQVLNKNKIHYHKGKTWTIDALYRETKSKIEKRKAMGAITVEMECAAMAAVAKFRNVKFCQMFYGADSLAAEEYNPRSLEEDDVSKKDKIIPLALECGIALNNNLK